MLYLIFDKKEQIIKSLVNKIKQENCTVYGKKEEDVFKFSSDVILCYNNNQVLENCIKNNKYCIYITDKEINYKNDINLLFIKVNLFDLNQIKLSERDTFENLTML